MNNIQNYGSVNVNANYGKVNRSPNFKAKIEFKLSKKFYGVDFEKIAELFEQKTKGLTGDVVVRDHGISASTIENNVVAPCCGMGYFEKSFSKFLHENNPETIANGFVQFYNAAALLEKNGFKNEYSTLTKLPIIGKILN